MRENGVQQIDLCKVDIEGAEPDFIAGATEALISGKVKAIYMEINPEALARANKMPKDIYTGLRELGFHLLFPYRNTRGPCSKYDTFSGFIELSDFDESLVCGQFDILGLHDSSSIWKSRAGEATTKVSSEFEAR
jgi:hypothetical protein